MCFPPTARLSSLFSPERLSKHITFSCVSATAARLRGGTPESDAVCCGVLTLGIMQTGHCVCLLRVGLSLFRLSQTLWLVKWRDTTRTLYTTGQIHIYLKEDSLSPSLPHSIIFHWATKETWQSWQAVAVGEHEIQVHLFFTHTHAHTHLQAYCLLYMQGLFLPVLSRSHSELYSIFTLQICNHSEL